MKTQKEVEEKLEKLDQRMMDNMPTKESNNELLEAIKAKKNTEEVMEKNASRMVYSISLDAQRLILQWVLGHHDED